MDIISVALVCVLVALYTFQTLFCKLFSGAYPGEPKNTSAVFTIFYGLVISLISLAAAGFTFAPSPATVILGIINGAVLYTFNISLITGNQSGPYSLIMISMLFGGILVPMAENLIFFNGSLNIPQYIAIAMMLAAFVLLNYEKSGTDAKRPPKRFYIACALLFLTNGLYTTLIDAQQKLSSGAMRSEMIIMTYAVSALMAFTVLVAGSGGVKKLAGSLRLNIRSALFIAVSSSAAVSALFLMMKCLERINSVVLYTVDNGGVLLVSVMISFIMFREKPTWTKICGVVFSLASIIMLSVF